MQKPTTKQILHQIREFTGRASISYNSRATGEDFDAEVKKMQELMAEIQEFDKSLGPGLKVGRLVSWPQADGQAFYFVTSMGRRTVKLAWLQWLDAWQSPVVVDGEALRPAVERAIHATDGLRRIFGRRAVNPTQGGA